MRTARNDRQIDDLEYALVSELLRRDFGIEAPGRDEAVSFGSQLCDLVAGAATLADVDPLVQPLLAESGLPIGQAATLVGAFGGLMCLDEFIRLGAPVP